MRWGGRAAAGARPSARYRPDLGPRRVVVDRAAAPAPRSRPARQPAARATASPPHVDHGGREVHPQVTPADRGRRPGRRRAQGAARRRRSRASSPFAARGVGEQALEREQALRAAARRSRPSRDAGSSDPLAATGDPPIIAATSRGRSRARARPSRRRRRCRDSRRRRRGRSQRSGCPAPWPARARSRAARHRPAEAPAKIASRSDEPAAADHAVEVGDADQAGRARPLRQAASRRRPRSRATAAGPPCRRTGRCRRRRRRRRACCGSCARR